MSRFDKTPSRMIDQHWPALDLEPVSRCPACGSHLVTLEVAGVRDWAFEAAPGSWNFWRCGHCQSLFLNPRPTAQSIGRAYQRYYTHAAVPSQPDQSSHADCHRAERMPPARADTFVHKLRQECFFHWLGIDREPRLHLPESALTRAALALLKPFVARQAPLDQLAKLPRGRLLDVGCGNGELMEVAQAMGFAVTGIEIDGPAVMAARSRKLDVRQGSFANFDALLDFAESGTASAGFDYVVCSHVLEHVHKPLELLDWLTRAARPGGRIFVVWPNPQSSMLRIFGRHWRGLEAPRHLCLLSAKAVSAGLMKQNITHVEYASQGWQTVGESLRLRREGRASTHWTDAGLDKLARFASFFLRRWISPDFLAASFKTPLDNQKPSATQNIHNTNPGK